MTQVNKEYDRDRSLSKPLPSNPEAEKTILGAILIDNSLINEAIEFLKPNMFYSPLNKTVFQAMINLYIAEKPIDAILVGEELKKTTSLETIGGITTIAGLMYGLPTFRNISNYIKIVVTKHKSREFIKACGLAVTKALDEDEEISSIMEVHESTVFNLSQGNSAKHKSVTVGELINDKVKRIQAQARNDSKIIGLSTGYKDLDVLMGGMRKKNLIVVAARSSMGKSTICLNIAQNVVDTDIEQSAVVAFFSIEMSKDELMEKFVSADTKIDSKRIEQGFLARDEWVKLSESAIKFTNQQIIIEDFEDVEDDITPLKIKAMARKIIVERKRLDLIIIDHLSLMKGSQKKYESTHKELSEITRELKQMAKALDVPVIVIGQLSRTVEKRNPPIPIMSDLRESGSIEENADICAFIYREAYYNETENNRTEADVYVRKNRNGATGRAKLSFFREHSRFENREL